MVPSLNIFLAILAASATAHFQASATLDWASSPPDGATVLACVGQEVILQWNFTVEAGDQVQDIRWYVADNTSQQLMATFIDGNFLSVPHFSGRLRHLGQAMLALDHVSAKDKASYSVEVDMHLASGMYDTEQKSVHLVVAPPITSSGELTVSQNRHAAYDNVTGLWHVTLTCGIFTELGQPHIDVFWKTPSGASLPSNNYDNGYFELLLDNPVEGGNYFCRINPSSPAAACFQVDDPMMKEVKVSVDEVKARLTLNEANQGALQSELRTEIQQQQMDNADLNIKNANLTDQLQSLVTQHHKDITNLTQHVHSLETQQSQLKTENADLTDQLQSLETQHFTEITNLTQHVHSLEYNVLSLQTKLDHYHRDNTNLTNYVHNLQAELTHFHEAATARVSFHARLSSSIGQVNEGNPVILTIVKSNEGGSYSDTTGQFTVPRNGTYAFFTSVEASSSNTITSGVYVMIDNTGEVCLTRTYYSGLQGSSCHAVLHLVKGQRVWLRAYTTSYFSWPGTVFSGFLLNADE